MTEKKPYRAIPIEEILAEMSQERRDYIDWRVKEMKAEADALNALRELLKSKKRQIARCLGIKQPAVRMMEDQADLYLSTLSQIIEETGGTLTLVIELPGKGPMRLTGIGDISA